MGKVRTYQVRAEREVPEWLVPIYEATHAIVWFKVTDTRPDEEGGIDTLVAQWREDGWTVEYQAVGEN